MKCFYHSADLDGLCSGAIVKDAFPNCGMIGVNYGEPFPWEGIEYGEVVIMVDFSLESEREMDDLNRWARLRWIDHHKTAIETCTNLDIKGLRRDGVAACELVWEYYGPRENKDSSRVKPTPLAVIYLGRFDVWVHDDPRVVPFQYGMMAYDNNPGNQVWWKHLFDKDNSDTIDKIIEEGQTIQRYVERMDARYMKAFAFDMEFEGLKCIAANKLHTNSQSFKSVWDPEKYDAMILFGYRQGKWVVSMYSEGDVDVGEVAKKWGGGGHKNAAGFQTEKLRVPEGEKEG